jgi:ribonuclease T1
MTTRRRWGGVGRAVLALLASLWLVIAVAACASPSASTASGIPASTGSPASTAPIPVASTASPKATQPARDPASGLATIARADLPAEATATLILIDAGGPFPYRQDGVVFQNREGILPDQPSGYYREYTVETPGSADRGARRIIVGREGERYYTADHYASFKRIWP